MADDPEHCTLSYVVQSILERDAEVQPMNDFNTEAPQSAIIQASCQQHPQQNLQNLDNDNKLLGSSSAPLPSKASQCFWDP